MSLSGLPRGLAPAKAFPRSRRNPWQEQECLVHMVAYSTFFSSLQIFLSVEPSSTYLPFDSYLPRRSDLNMNSQGAYIANMQPPQVLLVIIITMIHAVWKLIFLMCYFGICISLDMLSPREHIEKIRRDRFYIGKEEKNPLAEDMHLAVNYLSEELYSKDVHFLMELIQNAEDNEYPSDVTPSLDFVVTSNDITATGAASTLLIFNNEKGFSPANIESICRVGKSTKKGQRDHGYIGEKGIGFKSVFLVSSQPHIFSNGYQIKFSEEPSPECEIGYILPEWVEEHPTVFDLKEIYGSTKVLPTTTIILPLKSEKVPAVRKQLSSVHPELLLFLSKIRKLSVKENSDENTKQTALTEVSISSEKDYQTRKNMDAESYTLHLDAEKVGNEEQCSYYMWKQKFPVKPECHEKKRKEVDQWTITLAFPHGQRLGGAQSPGIYAFLPTEMVTNFPFIIQADFLLASSREGILLDSPWNKGILECVPYAFVNALVALVRSTSDAPAFSLPPKFKFLPVQASPFQLLESIRISIKNKMLAEHIIPCESYNRQKIFCKPGEVRRLASAFWNILDKAEKSGIDLQSISSHGFYVLSSNFDTKEFDDVLRFLEIGYMDWGWYPKCIEGSDLVNPASEELYAMLLYFVAENWGKFGYRIYDIALLKYEDARGVVSACSIIQGSLQGGFRICIASEEKIISWLIHWNRELSSVSNHFFMPLNTQIYLKNFCKSEIVINWLQKYVKVKVFTVYEYGLVSKAAKDRRLAIVFANFLYHSWEKKYISDYRVKELCTSMPILDNYGSIVNYWTEVLVPAKDSKWVGLMGSNPWRSENYVELSGDYSKDSHFASNYTPGRALFSFIKSNIGAADIPNICPPNACFPTVASPLTKENAFLLLDWIRNLSFGRFAIPSKFLDCVKSGNWLKTSTGYKAPKDSFLSSENWGSLLQIGSDMVDVPMIDDEFYDNCLSNYKNVLRLIGVKFEFGEASEMIGKQLMSRAAVGTLTKSNVLSLLGLIRFLRDKHLSPTYLIETLMKERWLKTCVGNRSPIESFLYSSEWAAASCIAYFPFIDEQFYGKNIQDYKVELELLGVHVRLGDGSNYFKLMVDKLKFPPNLSKPEALLLLLECMQHINIPPTNLEKLKHIKAVKTNLGFRLPTEAVFPIPEWGSLFTVLNGIPVVDVEFYGADVIRSYTKELGDLGVSVQPDQVSEILSFRFKELVSAAYFVKNNVLSLLECYRQFKEEQHFLPQDLVSSMKKENWLQTKMGLRAPADSVLFSSKWDSISSIATVPFIEYSSDIEGYKKELRDLGVAVTLEQGAGFVLKGINLLTEMTTMTPSSVLLLLKCIKYWNADLPEEFLHGIRKKWLKTHLGYCCPEKSLLFDLDHSSVIRRGDGPFIDEDFYGPAIADYKDQLQKIGVEVDITNGCSLVARHLKCHSEGSTIMRIYKFLWEFKWKPKNKKQSWIWIPREDDEGDWVCPEHCVLRDNNNLFDSQLHILDKFYEEDLLRFFSVAFDVKDMPDIEDYMKLWDRWEQSTTSHVSQDDCSIFWEFIGLHWNPDCEKLLAEHVKKLPILIGDGISLISKRELFIPNDLLLRDLFDEPLFVWYPKKSTPLARLKLTHIYTSLGVRKFSEVVEKHESYASDSQGSDNVTIVESSANVVKEGLLRIILAFLANPCLDICAKERQDMVKSLLDLTIIEADEPVNIQYKITFSGRQFQAKTTRLFRWERNESKLYMRCVAEVQGMEGRIRYATCLSDEISRGLLYDRADLVETLAELLKFGCLLDYEIAAVSFLLKNKNLQVFAEDEEFLALHMKVLRDYEMV